MSTLIRKKSPGDDFLEKPPFPLIGAAAGLIVIVNLASTVLTLLAI